MPRSLRWLCGIALAGLPVGCGNLRATPIAASVPQAYHTVVPPFIVLTNAALPTDAPVLEELARLRRDMATALPLPPPRRQIEIYIFDDRASYEKFLRTYYPGLPGRRAYFIAQDEREVVYMFQGDRFDEDLRHEAAHAILHASFRRVPLWLDEGLAEYFECPGEAAGLHARHAAETRRAIEQGWRPGLTRLESFTDVRRMTAADYREAWAWVYYLLHGSAGGRELLLGYLAEQGETPPEPLSARLFQSLSRPDQGMLEFYTQLGSDGPTPSVGE